MSVESGQKAAGRDWCNSPVGESVVIDDDDDDDDDGEPPSVMVLSDKSGSPRVVVVIVVIVPAGRGFVVVVVVPPPSIKTDSNTNGSLCAEVVVLEVWASHAGGPTPDVRAFAPPSARY
jgi:hypothetical protein